ncbi:MAG: serine protease [Planctomycetes bacterium]|nr:serine protease [Planctomycetota bacterium]
MICILSIALLLSPADEAPEQPSRAALQRLRRAVDAIVHVRILRSGMVERTLSGALVSATGTADFVVTSLPAGGGFSREDRSFQVVRKDFDAVPAEWVGLDDRTGIVLLRTSPGGVRPPAPARGLGLRPRARLYLVMNPLGLQANVERVSGRDLELLPPGDTISCMRLGFEPPCRADAAGGILADENGRPVALISAPPEDPRPDARLAARAGAALAPEGPSAVEPTFCRAIPMEVIVRICGALAKTGQVERGHVGATFGWPSDEQRAEYGQGAAGIVVVDVRPGGPAARAGLRPGDLLTEAGGEPIRSVRDALSVAERVEFELAGRSLRVKVLRPPSIGELLEITIGVEPLPASPPSPPPADSSPR